MRMLFLSVAVLATVSAGAQDVRFGLQVGSSRMADQAFLLQTKAAESTPTGTVYTYQRAAHPNATPITLSAGWKTNGGELSLDLHRLSQSGDLTLANPTDRFVIHRRFSVTQADVLWRAPLAPVGRTHLVFNAGVRGVSTKDEPYAADTYLVSTGALSQSVTGGALRQDLYGVVVGFTLQLELTSRLSLEGDLRQALLQGRTSRDAEFRRYPLSTPATTTTVLGFWDHTRINTQEGCVRLNIRVTNAMEGHVGFEQRDAGLLKYGGLMGGLTVHF